MFIFSKKQIKIFIGTSAAIFIMVALQLLEVRVPRIIFPTPNSADTFFDKVLPKLEEKQNSYRIKSNQNLIPQANASSEYDLASAYAVIDFDSGEVISGKNLSKPLPIASLTKVMTAVVALDLANQEEMFTATENASKIIPTKIGIRPQEQLTLKELLEASLLTSANDAVEVIREGIDKKYNEKVFIKAMNEKAKSIGLRNTSFTNPQGFDSRNHFSSVEDLAILTHYALENYPLIADLVKKDYSMLPANSYHKRFDLNNWNGLIGVYPNTTGVKIGNTGNAKKTTIVVSERNGKKLIAIVLGAPGIIERDLWAAQLLDYGYQKSMGLAAVNIAEEQLRAKYTTWNYWN